MNKQKIGNGAAPRKVLYVNNSLFIQIFRLQDHMDDAMLNRTKETINLLHELSELLDHLMDPKEICSDDYHWSASTTDSV